MMLPMTQLVRDRKTTTARITIALDGNDRLIAEANDPGFAAFQSAVAYLGTHFPGYCLDIDIVRAGNAERLQKLLGLAESPQTGLPSSSMAPSSRRSARISSISFSVMPSPLRAAIVRRLFNLASSLANRTRTAARSLIGS